MERMMSRLAHDPIAESLHQCNARLGQALNGLDAGSTPGCQQVRPASPNVMAGLLSELMTAGEWLRSLPREQGPDLKLELGLYRKNVERLRELMPSIHSALLQERAHLEQERGRVEAAAEWARRSRLTL
jgi:hypothetical protein